MLILSNLCFLKEHYEPEHQVSGEDCNRSISKWLLLEFSFSFYQYATRIFIISLSCLFQLKISEILEAVNKAQYLISHNATFTNNQVTYSSVLRSTQGNVSELVENDSILWSSVAGKWEIQAEHHRLLQTVRRMDQDIGECWI